MTHDEAIAALCRCAATVTVLSYQEVVEGYFKLRDCPPLDELTTALAASRAREAKLREALEKIELHTWGYPDRWEPMRVEMRHIARAALSASEDAQQGG